MLSPVSLSPPIIVHRRRWYQRKIYHWCHCHRQPVFACVVDTGDQRKSVTKINHRCHKFVSGVVDTAEQFITSVVDTADKHSFAIISANFFEKSLNDPNGILRGPGDTHSWKKMKSKIMCQTPFKKWGLGNKMFVSVKDTVDELILLRVMNMPGIFTNTQYV